VQKKHAEDSYTPQSVYACRDACSVLVCARACGCTAYKQPANIPCRLQVRLPGKEHQFVDALAMTAGQLIEQLLTGNNVRTCDMPFFAEAL